MTDASHPSDLEILQYPHPILRRKAREVVVFNTGLATTVERMRDLMIERRGVGLAAPQVGISQRFFITHHRPQEGADEVFQAWINPRIVAHEGTASYEEGCLSFPGMYAKVERHRLIEVCWQDLEGTPQTGRFDYEASDFLAIVIQHELDHLDGILFVDHLTMAQLTLLKRRLREMEKRYKVAHGSNGSLLRR